MMIKCLTLEATSGPYAGKEIKVERGQVVRVGRTPKAEVVTLDPYMSGEHFALECGGETCRILDLNSRHGTFLNKERISEAILHEGDQIYAGETTLIVHIEEAEQAAEPPPIIRRYDVLPAEQYETTPSVEIGSLIGPAEMPPVNSFVSSPDVDEVPTAPDTVAMVMPRSGNSPEPITELDQPPAQEQIPEPPLVAVSAPMPAPTPGPLPSAPEPPPAPPERAVFRALEISLSESPAGRLMSILREHHESLFALLDAAREPVVPQLLRDSGEEYQSLYEGEAFADVAPYLVYLAASSPLLDKLVHKGWGRGWIVYLTCALPLPATREYFRQSLMIKMPDGREFFSRFYDPRFFRRFLRGCTQTEADRFFGPINSYLMEAENPEILLQFIMSGKGVEVKERLLLIPGT